MNKKWMMVRQTSTCLTTDRTRPNNSNSNKLLMISKSKTKSKPKMRTSKSSRIRLIKRSERTNLTSLTRRCKSKWINLNSLN